MKVTATALGQALCAVQEHRALVNAELTQLVTLLQSVALCVDRGETMTAIALLKTAADLEAETVDDCTITTAFARSVGLYARWQQTEQQAECER
jgi:hypothetical protein